ncbi:MAG: SpoIIE family protein phosphatase [Candidatus Eremiobacteraeota bacterium]|nr:SpoIIE family protein phosphatase [Candidatus Eremiobacteraeota bacterium]
MLAVFSLLLLVAIGGIGAFALLQNERAAFASLEATAAAQFANDDALVLIVDEETGMRGYAEVGNISFLAPYQAASERETAVFSALALRVAYFGSRDLDALVHDMRATHQRWKREVAEPVIARRARANIKDEEFKGKFYVDRTRADSAALDAALQALYGRAEDRAGRGFARVAAATFLALVVATALIFALGVRQYRLREERDRDRRTVDVLQRAFINRTQTLPNTTVASVYLSATREAAVGGDLFDVRERGDGGGLIAIGDVAGKGIEAALDTIHIRDALGSLAEALDDPGEILQRFNAQYTVAVRRRDTFTSAILILVDLQRLRARYANAGHASAWLLRAARARPLAVTGPILGVMQDARFTTESIELMPDDVLVLATDGLTEGLDPTRQGDGLETAARWIEEASTTDPQTVVDSLIAKLRAIAGSEIGDDLAILAIRFDGAPAR